MYTDIPTSGLADVIGISFDLRELKFINAGIRSGDEQIELGCGVWV
jgi:hypothetical protein